MAGGGNENYQVSFVDDDNVISTVDVDKNSYVKEPAVPAKEGYIFAGWYSDSACTKTFDFKNTKITSDTKIYAKFISEDEKFTVSFNSNGGSSIASQTVNAGEKVTKPSDPTKTNFKFAGWYCDSALSEAYDFSTPVLSNITLYAKWTAESGTFTVTFNSNGGSAVPAQTVKAGEKAVKPANPTKSGSTFSGWYSDAALTTQYNFNSAVTANITLYAKWTTSSGGGGGGGPSYTYYTVTFNSNDGSAVSSKTIKSGSVVEKPADPTKTGYTFAGWYSNEALTVAYDFNSKVTGNITLYANWTAGTVEVEESDKTAATVSDITSENISNLVTDGTFEVNLSNPEEFKDVKSVTIDNSSLSALNGSDSVNNVKIELPEASLTIPKAVLPDTTSGTPTLVLSVSEGTSGSLEVSSKTAYKFNLSDGTNDISLSSSETITLSFKANSTDSLFTVATTLVTQALQAYAMSLSVNESNTDAITMLKSADETGVITFETSDLSKYYMVADTLKTMIDKTVIEANNWLGDSSFKDWFEFVAATDDNGKITVTLKIDVSQIWEGNYKTTASTMGAQESTITTDWNGFLTNLGNLFKENFTDIGVTTIKADSYTIFNDGSFQSKAFTDFFVHSLVGVNDGVNDNGIFKVLSTMDKDSNDVRTISVEVSGTEGKVSNVSFDAVINVWQPENYAPHNDDVTAISKIASFAGTISKHLSLEEKDDKLSLTITAPDKLVESALKQVKKNDSDADYNKLAEKFNEMSVSSLLTKIASLKTEEVFGSQSSAVNKFIGFLNSNDVFINKVLQKTQISFDEGSESPVVIFDHDKTFTIPSDDSGPNPPSDWSKFVTTLSSVLTESAGEETPGAYWNTTTKMYEMNAKISVDLSNFNNAAKAETGANAAGSDSFGISMDVKIVLDVFGENHRNEVDTSKTPSTETNQPTE